MVTRIGRSPRFTTSTIALYDIDHIDAALLLPARDLASHARDRGAVADAA